MSSDLD